MQNTIFKTLLMALLTVTTGAFVVTPSVKATCVRLEAGKQNEIIPSHVKAAAFATIATISQPMMALAEDDYEYGGKNVASFLGGFRVVYFFCFHAWKTSR